MTDMQSSFSEALLKWHASFARALPWRGEKDPYRIWISEIMLQQTRTETVKGYYRRFCEKFPDVYALANADEGEVMKMWEGLGYYSRARNLHAAARIVAFQMNGVFPDTQDALRKLPGIGEYAAGAIASIAFQRREPALDGNQARVLARVFAYQAVIRTPGELRALALPLVPVDEPGEYNQALMGLGAMICTPKKPRCGECPVKDMCLARARGIMESLPVKPEKLKRKIEKRAVVLVINDAGEVYVRKREGGMLAGLWEFPGYADARSADDVRACLEEDGIEAVPVCEIGAHKHIFTHLEWHMTGYVFKAEKAPGTCVFLGKEALERLAMPTALIKYREYYMNREKT